MDYDFVDFGDCRQIMREWAVEGIRAQTCVTSPPYFGLRDYGHAGQIGMGQTPDQYIEAMVEVFRGVRDVLADDGTLWLNLGDSYGAAKQLMGIPWRVALALQADGWYLRQDIIWHKPNPMPESVRDRCTKAHEYIFILTKSPKYFFDSDAIKEPSIWYGKDARSDKGNIRYEGKRTQDTSGKNGQQGFATVTEFRNKRSVWTITTKPFKGAHFATFPADLIEPCILAGSRIGDVVLDPFMGSGTTAMVARKLGRKYIGCELNESYGELQDARIRSLDRL